MVVSGQAVGHRACARAWMSEDPLPGHRTSSTPGIAIGAVAEWPWPASPGCPPPAGAPGPGCPFPCCAAAVAASSLARAASAAQPSDWTSRQRETSSANTHSEQPCRHDNLSIQRSVQPFLALFPLPKPFTQSIQPPQFQPGWWMARRWEKKFLYFLARNIAVCLHLTCVPALPPLVQIV